MRSWLHLDRQFEESADALGSVQVATSRRGRDCRPRSSQEPVAAIFEGGTLRRRRQVAGHRTW